MSSHDIDHPSRHAPWKRRQPDTPISDDTDQEIDHEAGPSYTIKEAAAVVGESELTIFRRIERDRFPNAGLRPGPSGQEWRIPVDDLAKVASEDGWAINLDYSEARSDDHSQDVSAAILAEALNDRARVRSELDLLSKDVQLLDEKLEERTRERDQARSDLEHERAGHDQTTAKLIEVEKDLSASEARTEVLQTEIDKAQGRAQLVEREAVSMGEKYTQTSEQLAETTDRVESLAGDVESLSEAVAAAETETKRVAALGWRDRRRYRKETS